MIDITGSYIKGSGVVELIPNVIQVLGFIRLLGLHQNKKINQTIKCWLMNLPKQILEIVDNTGKYIQISLISMLFATTRNGAPATYIQLHNLEDLEAQTNRDL